MDINFSTDGTSGPDWIGLQSARLANTYQRAPFRPPKELPSTGSGVFTFAKTPGSRTSSVDELNLIAAAEMATPEVATDPVVEKARDDRLNLLAMKFSGLHQPVEHLARLHILTNRLRALTPPVTNADWQRCEEIATGIADRSAEIAALEEELGLS